MLNESSLSEHLLKQQITEHLKQSGCLEIRFLNDREARFGEWYQPWIENGYHADMEWMQRHAEFRSRPASLEPWAATIISLSFPYYTKAPKSWNHQHIISNYAWGKDYHKELKKRLKPLLNELSEKIENLQFRILVDSAPVPEKIIGAQSGMGWIGKNSMLIHPEHGSWFFLAEVLINLDLPSDESTIPDRCGKCTLCIDACPTGAILPGRVVDASRCISWMTIEKKGGFEAGEKKPEYQLFGCDICQQVCPWNKKVSEVEDPAFKIDEKWNDISPEKVLEWQGKEFEVLKINSPLKRPGLSGLKRNARAILKSKDDN